MLGFSRERTNRIHIDVHREGFIIGIGSWDYEEQEVPWSAVYRLENRKASGVIQSNSEGLRTKRADNVSPSPNPKALEPIKLYRSTGEGEFPSSSKEEMCPSSAF